jgi:hypothetical protein
MKNVGCVVFCGVRYISQESMRTMRTVLPYLSGGGIVAVALRVVRSDRKGIQYPGV